MIKSKLIMYKKHLTNGKWWRIKLDSDTGFFIGNVLFAIEIGSISFFLCFLIITPLEHPYKNLISNPLFQISMASLAVSIVTFGLMCLFMYVESYLDDKY